MSTSLDSAAVNLSSLERRPGDRPLTAEGPHRQLDQQATPEVWGNLLAHVLSTPGVEEAVSAAAPASTRAIVFTDLHVTEVPGVTLAPGGRLEPVHLHGVEDTSLHVVLPPELGARLEELGWAEPHPHAIRGTAWMVYGPRCCGELDTVLEIVDAALEFARSGASGA